MNFKQCHLTRPRKGHGLAVAHYTTWLPEEFARVGRVVDLKFLYGWEEGWTVRDVYTTRPEEYVREHERDYRHQAEASDKTTPNRGLGLERKG